MSARPKIVFDHRKARAIDDVTDLVDLLFPGNRRQQYAAARILMRLKTSAGVPIPLGGTGREHGISRRILERTRAKLARLGLIDRVTWMNSRFGGRQGWKLSGRMSAGLRALAQEIDTWRSRNEPQEVRKEEMLVGLIMPWRHSPTGAEPNEIALSEPDRETATFKNS